MVNPIPSQRSKPVETIECAACHMKVIARGDWQGWKPVALPDGRQVWYCNKAVCQEQRDNVLLQVQAGNIPAVLRAGTPGNLVERTGVPTVKEVEALQARIAELEAENAQLKGEAPAGQSTAEEPPKGELPPHVQKQTPKHVRVHVDGGDGKALCGAECEPDVLKLPEVMAFDDVACDACVEAWSAKQQGKEASRAAEEALSSPTKDETAEPSEPVQAPQPQALALPEPAPGLPPIDDYSKLPKLDRDLIARINDGAEVDGPILLPQSVYPDIDFGRAQPGQFRTAIGRFFTGLEVEAIDRAYQDGQVLGLVFTLRQRPAVDSAAEGSQEGA